MTDTTDPLTEANKAIALLESRLMAQLDARMHPIWSEGGEVVLIGDYGHLVDGTDGAVVRIDGFHSTVDIKVGNRTYKAQPFNMLRRLERRGEIVGPRR